MSVPDFYAGASVLITGGNGFLGKVIIEKILYSCPKVREIYILIRKKAKEENSMFSMLESPVFDRLRDQSKENPKIIRINGDIVQPMLGVGVDNEKLLIERVSIVIHAAATVRFDEPLKQALSTNVLGTKNVLEMCLRMKNIKALVHVSTAYCHAVGDQRMVEEKLYPPLMDLKKVYQLARDLNEEIPEPSLYGRPNTYTFTKALAETVVKDLCGEIPTAIVRPSIVTPAKSEPMRGWVDNWYGATAILIAIGKGYCKYIIGCKENIVDIIPVDYVANAIIVAAASLQRSDDIKVLNVCSSSSNPLTMGQLSYHFTEQCVQHGFNDLPYPHAWTVQDTRLGRLLALFLEVIPAHIADLWRLSLGKPQKYVKLQAQVEKIRNVLRYFTNHSWVMQADSMSALAAELSPEDTCIFPCDPRDIKWKEYTATYYYGVKKYLVDMAKK